MDFYVRYRRCGRHGYFYCRIGSRRFRVRDAISVFELFERFGAFAFVLDERTASLLPLSEVA
jgi:hypothetical protein